ncbi:hypothetical protein [Endozoicomonas elysicola]|nr:hypothetical protein [Endozoicomonas elysicola]
MTRYPLLYLLLLLSSMAQAIGRLSIGNTDLPLVETEWILGQPSISTSIDLCLVSSVYWAFSGWKPEPFWVEVRPKSAGNGYHLGDNQQIPVTFTFQKNGEGARDIKEGQPSANIAGNNQCNGTNLYKLNVTMYVDGHEFYGSTYSGAFTLRLGWSHDGQTAEIGFDLSLVVPEAAYVSGLEHLTLVDSGSGWTDENNFVCVYSSTNNAKYNVEASGENSTTDFKLKMDNSDAAPIDYTLEWKDRNGRWRTFTPGKIIQNRKGSSSVDCLDGHLSGVKATAYPDGTSQPGVYQDTVTITVYPR